MDFRIGDRVSVGARKGVVIFIDKEGHKDHPYLFLADIPDANNLHDGWSVVPRYPEVFAGIDTHKRCRWCSGNVLVHTNRKKISGSFFFN